MGLAIIILITRNRRSLNVERVDLAQSSNAHTRSSAGSFRCCRSSARRSTAFSAGAGRRASSMPSRSARRDCRFSARLKPCANSLGFRRPDSLDRALLHLDHCRRTLHASTSRCRSINSPSSCCWSSPASASLIHIYSIGYMAHEGGYYRFFAYLNLFMFFMLMLVLAANYLLLFVGWEGVGLCSYLLIGFYFLKQFATRCRQQGVHRQPHRRFRLPARHVPDLRAPSARSISRTIFTQLARKCLTKPRQWHRSPPSASCCSSAPPASPRSFRSTSGCRTPWKAPRRSAR